MKYLLQNRANDNLYAAFAITILDLLQVLVLLDLWCRVQSAGEIILNCSRTVHNPEIGPITKLEHYFYDLASSEHFMCTEFDDHVS